MSNANETVRKIAMRSQVHAYMNLGTAETPVWTRCGPGWKKLSENPNAQTENVQYICDDAETTDTVSYSPQYSFECDLMYTDSTIKKVYDIAKRRKTGSECVLDMVFADAFETGSTVTAYRESVAAAVSSLDGTKKMTMSGNLNGQGGGIIGKFDVKNLAFTPDSADSADEPTAQN